MGASEGKGKALVEFLQSMIPIKYAHSKKLISHDSNSNTYNYKYTTSVDVVPICKDNVLVMRKVSQALHFIDPDTCQVVDMTAVNYYKNPFLPVSSIRDLVEYTVLNIEPILSKDRKTFAGQGKLSHRHVLADCWVVKSSELGHNDDDGTHCRTFLGAILSIGDTVLGLDLRNSNVNNPDMEKMSADKIPDVVLVKKVFGDKALRNRRRK